MVARQSGPLLIHSISLVLATTLASSRAVRTGNASTMPGLDKGLEIIPRIGPTSSNIISMHTILVSDWALAARSCCTCLKNLRHFNLPGICATCVTRRMN
ncbi:hypothetical protein EDB83DRAFT_2393960, partial [Lactarius deliciosus]